MQQLLFGIIGIVSVTVAFSVYPPIGYGLLAYFIVMSGRKS